MTQHTPGPWHIESVGTDTASNGLRVCTAGGMMLAHIYSDYDHAKTEADARLIAAAPDLYEFVQMIANGGLDSGVDHATIEAEAQAALATAKGNTALKRVRP